jgi:hypothetical protein
LTEEQRFVLAGYVPLTSHGFALPCYVREGGGNSWHVAVTQIPGDKLSTIVRFEHFESSEICHLEEPLWRAVGVKDQWQDVFLWGERTSVGMRHQILSDVQEVMNDILELAPLSAIDLAFDMGEDDLPLVAKASEWLRSRVNPGVFACTTFSASATTFCRPPE